MNLESRLNALKLRKAKHQMIVQAVREGKIPGLETATEHFERTQPHRQLDLSDRPEDGAGELLRQIPHGRFVERHGQRVLVFRAELSPGVGPEPLPYSLPITSVEPLLSSSTIEAIYPGLSEIPNDDRATRIAFIDTETNGLAGGTGTVAFLIGIGWLASLNPVRFVLEQYLIEDFCHEPLQLELVTERLSEFDAFGSYNGKSFDLPLLRARGILNRMRPAIWKKPHADLLHFSRRVWKGAFDDVSLGTVEREILSITRERDIESALIPEIWTDFARKGTVGQLADVIHHNAQDIASLAGLVAHHVELVQRSESPRTVTRPTECLGLARWFEKRKDAARAAKLYERALELVDGPENDRWVLYLARLHRRCRAYPQAEELWRGLMERPISASLEAWIDMAKHLEHRKRALDEAYRLTREAIRSVELETDLRNMTGRTVPDTLSPATLDGLYYRLSRLERKRARRDAAATR